MTIHSTPPEFQTGTSILLDIETLATSPGSLILSIAAIAFTRADQTVVDHIDLTPDFFEQLATHRETDADTIAFHRRNGTLPTLDPAEQTSCFQTIAELTAFIHLHQPQRVWIQGPDFDRPIIEDFCQQHNQPLPWHFSKSRDARTAYDIAFPGKKHAPSPHNALKDCAQTLTDLVAALTELNRLHAI